MIRELFILIVLLICTITIALMMSEIASLRRENTNLEATFQLYEINYKNNCNIALNNLRS